MLFRAVLLLVAISYVAAHFNGCAPMRSYMPPRVEAEYDMMKHNGTWYEVAFRDLYPWGPLCFCQQSIK